MTESEILKARIEAMLLAIRIKYPKGDDKK